MKKTSYFFLLTSFLLLLFASCDKIEENERLIPAGAKAQWEEGDGVVDQSQRTIIEKYTGVRCNNCPKAETTINEAVAAMNGRLLAVAIHDSGGFSKPYPNNPDMRCPVAQVWSQYFGVFDNGQYPTALVGRNRNTQGWALFNPVNDVSTAVSDALSQPNVIAVAVDATRKSNKIEVAVNLEYLQDFSDTLSLTLFIIEDSIHAMQILPDYTKDTNYIHNHVLRDAITDAWGVIIDDGRSEEELTAATPVKKGTKRKGNFKYEPKGEWNLANCHIVAMVSRYGNKRIMNVAECEVHE